MKTNTAKQMKRDQKDKPKMKKGDVDAVIKKLDVLHHTDAILRRHGLLWEDRQDGTGCLVDDATYKPASEARVEAFKKERTNWDEVKHHYSVLPGLKDTVKDEEEDGFWICAKHGCR